MFFVDSVSDWKTSWGHLRDSDRVAQKCLVLAMRWSSTNPRNMGSARVIKGEGRGERRVGDQGVLRHIEALYAMHTVYLFN